MKRLKLAKLRFDGDTQMRAALNGDTVAEYRDAMKSGVEFPPIVAFFDGSDYWIGDGYHRWHAAGDAGLDDFPCDVRQGSRRDAILWACGANGSHGLRRTNEDKHRAVKTLLMDSEWVTWSDHVIAEKCGVSQPFVGKLREQLITVISSAMKRKGKDGKIRKQKTPTIVKVQPVTVEGSDQAEYEPEQADEQQVETKASPGVIERFKPFWNALSSQEQATLFVWINDQLS